MATTSKTTVWSACMIIAGQPWWLCHDMDGSGRPLLRPGKRRPYDVVVADDVAELHEHWTDAGLDLDDIRGETWEM